MIFSIIAAIIILPSSPILLIMGFSSEIREEVLNNIHNGTISYHGNGMTPEEFVTVMQATFAALGIMMIVVGIACVINAIISSLAMRKGTRGLYIAAIITGVLSTDFSIPGGILGLILLSRDKNKSEFDKLLDD